MSDTLITVVAIALVATTIFVIPLMTTADRVDDITKTKVEAIVSNFVNEIQTSRKISQENYDKFTQDLKSLGYKFDTSMEVRQLDENPGKKTSQTAKDKIGENVYYSEYTTQIMQELEKSGVKDLKSGDIVLVTVSNENKTLAKQLRSLMYKVVGSDTADVVASKAGMVQ